MLNSTLSIDSLPRDKLENMRKDLVVKDFLTSKYIRI